MTGTLNIRSVPEDTRKRLRVYAAMTGLKQAEALGEALRVAIAWEESQQNNK